MTAFLKDRSLFFNQFAMAEFPDLQPSQPFSGISTDHQPISSTAQPAAEVLPAAPYRHHGEVLHVEQAWLDLVRIQFCKYCRILVVLVIL